VFITAQQLNQAIHDTLQKADSVPLEGYWLSLVQRSLTWSYNEILQRIGQRGYSQTLINQWDRGAEFQTDMGVWRALQWVSTQTTLKIHQDALNLLDRRKELSGGISTAGGKGNIAITGYDDPVMLTINGVLVYPDTTVSQPTTGPICGMGPQGHPWEHLAANGSRWGWDDYQNWEGWSDVLGYFGGP
jgi:hypothetical protein